MKKKYRFDIKRMGADCEANYARLCRLFPQVLALAGEARHQSGASGWQDFVATRRELLVEMPSGSLVMQLSVVEQSRYTTTVDLASGSPAVEASGFCWRSDVADNWLKMVVRMYHDVQMAEVLTCGGKKASWPRYDYPNQAMFQADEKAQQNYFLSEVLSLGLRSGMSADLVAPLKSIEAGITAVHSDCQIN